MVKKLLVKKLMLMVSISIVFVLVACGAGGPAGGGGGAAGGGGGGAAGGGGGGAAAAPAGQVVELTLWHYFSHLEGEKMTLYAETFNEAHPGIRVTETFVARDDLLRQYTMGVISGDLPDIGMVDNPDHASFAALGVFYDITDQVMAWGEKDAFFDGPMLSTILDGRIYGLPNNSNCLALFYNRQMLADAGVSVPSTWAELEAASSILTSGDTFGLAISAIGNEEGTFQFMPWFISAGGYIDNLAGPGPVRAVNFLNDLIESGYMSRDVINWTQADANMHFIGGRAAMQVNGPWQIANIERDAPDLDWGVALIPRDVRYASVLGGENFGIGAFTDHADAAFTFMTWFHGAEVLANWNLDTGKFPPRSDSLQLKDIWVTDPVLSVFGEALQYAMPRGPHPRWPEISNAMSTAFHEVFTGTRSAEDAMGTAAERFAEIMAE